MTEKPPADPADHAEDFSRRYAEDLEIVAGQAMMDLGISNDQMGERDHERGSQINSFFPQDGQGGTVSHAGQVTLDSGLMNPEFLRRMTTRTPDGPGSGPASGTATRRSSPTNWPSTNTAATTNWLSSPGRKQSGR